MNLYGSHQEELIKIEKSEQLKLQNKFLTSENEKEIALEKLKIERAEIDGTTRRWVADARSGNWLAANVRPLVLIFLVVSYVIGWYMSYSLDQITGLLTIVIGGYFGSRGAEKIFGNKMHK